MRRYVFVLLALLGIGLLSLWQLPTILKAMPSRYVARLPEPLQALGERGSGVAILPTVAAPANAENLLQVTNTPTAAAVVPPTLTPQPLAQATQTAPAPTATATAVPTATATPIPIPASFRLENVWHQFQTWNNCGPATTAMALSYFGLYLNQAETAAFLKPDPEDRNVSPYEISRYVNEQTSYAALDRSNGTLDNVKRLVANGFPVMIELGIEPPGEYRWLGWYGHYLLVVAYDEALGQFWVYDSWFGTSDVPMENASVNGRILHYEEADQQWRQFNRNYIVFYEPERASEAALIIGEDMDDGIMWQKSLARTQAELAEAPDDAFLWLNLGTVYNGLGQYEEAATAFDQARSLGLPWRLLWYQFDLYEAYYQVGRYEDIVTLATVTLEDRPYFEETFYYRGLALAALGEAEQARADFQRAVAFNPYFEPAATALAEK